MSSTNGKTPRRTKSLQKAVSIKGARGLEAFGEAENELGESMQGISQNAIAMSVGLGRADVGLLTSAWLIGEAVGLKLPPIEPPELLYGLRPFSPTLDCLPASLDLSRYKLPVHDDERLRPIASLGMILTTYSPSYVEALGGYILKKRRDQTGRQPWAEEVLASIATQTKASH